MCGRYTLFSTDAAVETFFGAETIEGQHEPSYNQAPSELVRVAVGNEPRVLTLQQWGLVPSWAKPNFRPLINARAETLTEKPSFRTAAIRRRCLIPTNGYYEWGELAGRKQPYFISADYRVDKRIPGPETPLLAMAGIFDFWHGPNDEIIPTCAIITRDAPKHLDIHPRMPVFVRPDVWQEWLDPQLTDKTHVQQLVDSLPVPDLNVRQVNRAVGNVRTQDPELIFQ